MIPKTYKILDEAIEQGIEWGWARAHKHEDAPDEGRIKEHMHEQILNQICEYFTFGEDELI